MEQQISTQHSALSETALAECRVLIAVCYLRSKTHLPLRSSAKMENPQSARAESEDDLVKKRSYGGSCDYA
jgi:hypothetical protein